MATGSRVLFKFPEFLGSAMNMFSLFSNVGICHQNFLHSWGNKNLVVTHVGTRPLTGNSVQTWL
jgi:hypothetical protein